MDRTSQTAQGLASKGRYGDSMLVHMNPQEVAGLASLAPGQMTINPETGLPEAFSFTKLFDRIAPIAIPLALGAVAGPAAGGAASSTAAGGIFSNPLVQKSLFQGLTSAALAKMRGADTSDALNAGLTSGLVYGAGSKLLGVGAPATTETEVGLENIKTAPNPLVDSNYTTASDAANAARIAEINAANVGSANPKNLSYVRNKNFDTNLRSGGVDAFGRSRSELLMDEFDSKYPEFKDRTFDDGSSTSGGMSGFLKNIAPTSFTDTALMAGSTYAGQAMLPPEEEEERKRRAVAMTAPYPRNVRYPDGGYGSREYRYFQEGGAVNATAPVEDTPEDMGLGYYAPLIASYGANTSLPPMAATMPAGNYTTPTAPMGEGITSRSSVEGTYFTPPPERKLEVSDSELLSDIRERRAPEGFMWSANTPNIAPGVRGDTTYKLFPTKNLSRLEMQDLTSKGILTRYRPEGSGFSNYQPQVALRDDVKLIGGKVQNYDDFMARSGRAMQEGGITSLPQTEGQVDGRGDGMEDQVFGDIEGEQEVALSKDEFIVPADVVAGLGNGSSNAGASQLYEMMDRVRMARTGKKTQPPEIEAEQFMPA